MATLLVFRARSCYGLDSFLPNAQTEPFVCLAQIVPERSEEKARSVTSIRIGSSALLGSVLIFIFT